MAEQIYAVESISDFYTSRQEEKIIGYAAGRPEDIEDYYRRKCHGVISLTPLKVVRVTRQMADKVRELEKQLRENSSQLDNL